MIYKYLDEGTLEPVKNRTLKFATVLDLNDPFENLARVKIPDSEFRDQMARTEKQLRQTGILQSIPEPERDKLIAHVIENARKDFDGSQHLTATLRLQEKVQKSTAKELGILSLTSSRTNGLMWSHYTNKHQGFVLGFDESNSWFNPPPESGEVFGRIIPIAYTAERVALVKGGGEFETAFQPFLVKSLDWQYEDEQRVLLPLKVCTKINDTLHVREYPPDLLQEVIFGYRCSEDTVKAIKGALSGHDVSFFRAVPSSVSFDIEIESEESYYADLSQYEANLKKQAEAGGIDVTGLRLDV